MTGFIRGLFGGKSRKSGESAPSVKPSRPTRQPESEGNAFYLTPDDAKTYGDIDYMRTSKTVRRTFAKKRGAASENERINQVSAMDSVRLREDGTPVANGTPIATPVQPTANPEPPTFDRRKTDTNLDMFRQMAKDIKK